MSDINSNIIKVRLGAENAVKVISSLPTSKLTGLDDVNILDGLPDNSVLVYYSETEQWNPYPYNDGGTY